MSDLTPEAIMSIVARAVPAMAIKAVPTVSKQLGEVVSASFDTSEVSVLLDGDVDPIPVVNATGYQLLEGHRVVVDFYPPHGVLVTGVLSPTPMTARPWATAWGRVTGAVSTFDHEWQAVPDVMGTASNIKLYANRAYRYMMTCMIFCDTADQLTGFSLQINKASVGTWHQVKELRGTAPFASGSSSTFTVSGYVDFHVGADDLYDFQIIASQVLTTAGTFTVYGGNFLFSVDDVGPVVTGLPAVVV
jgi:hypothetical protein